MHLKRYEGKWYKSIGDNLIGNNGEDLIIPIHKIEKELECRDDIINYLNKMENENERTVII